MYRLLVGQRGAIFTIAAVAGLMLGSLIVIPVLATASTTLGGLRLLNSTDSGSADAAIEHALWRLIYEPGYADLMTPENPTDQYTFTLNEIDTQVTITSSATAPPDEAIQVNKTVDPQMSPVATLTTFTYTITIVNDDAVMREIVQVEDKLPPGFDYVPGSTTGLTTADPVLAGGWLTWEFLPYLQIPPDGETVQLQFQAEASKNQGTYYNRARVEIWGLDIFVTGTTAPVRFADAGDVDLIAVVNPTTALSGVQTTFSYTISMLNNDAEAHELQNVADVLPLGFSYLVGSTSGLTVADPEVSVDPDTGRDELRWTFSPPRPTLEPGQTAELSFQATATLGRGTFYDEGSIQLKDLTGQIHTVETGPSAPVRVVWSYQIVAEGPQRGVTATALILSGTADILSWVEY